jgi:hypothetical protein
VSKFCFTPSAMAVQWIRNGDSSLFRTHSYVRLMQRYDSYVCLPLHILNVNHVTNVTPVTTVLAIPASQVRAHLYCTTQHNCTVQYRHTCTVQGTHICTVQYRHTCNVQYRHTCTVQYRHTCTVQYRHTYTVQYRLL